MSFGAVSRLNSASQYDRITHFALDLGGVLEIYPTRRTILRFDVGELLARYGERTLSLSPGVSLIAPGDVTSYFEFSAGMSYRLGRLHEVEHRTGDVGSFRGYEVGGQFEWLSILAPPASSEVEVEPGFGGRFTYNASRWLGFDARVSYFYVNPNIVGYQEGGKIVQGFFGPKAGIRGEKIGAYFKFEPGFASYGETLSDPSGLLQTPIPFERATHFAFDIGGVVEYYPSSRAVIRFDVGQIEIFYGSKSVLTLLGQPTTAPAYHKTGLAISTGFGWRF